MRHMVYLIIGCVMLMLAAGCVRSVRAVFPESAGVGLLPTNAVLATNDNSGVYKVTRSGSGYAFDPAYAGGYKTALFVKLDGNGNYIGQVLTEKEGYLYALLQKEGNSLNLFTFLAGDVANKENLRVTKRLDNATVQIEDRAEMVTFYQTVALRHLDKATKTTYRIFDYDNPNERVLAENAMNSKDRSDGKSKSGGQQAASTAQQKSIPSSSGAWSLVQETDPMTDAKITRIVGRPSKFEGTTDTPSMRVSCGPKGLQFAIYWGAQMADQYPAGEADFVGVDVRFDRDEAVRLAWVPSSDWTTTFNPDKLAAGIGQMGQSVIEALIPSAKIIVAWDDAAFHLNMKNGKRLILRGSTRRDNWALMEFDLTGYAELARAFPGRCG